MKIHNKLFLAFGVPISFLIILSVFSGVQLYRVNKKYNEVLTSTIGRQSGTAKALASMNDLQHIILTKGYLATNDRRPDMIEELQANTSKIARLLVEYLDSYHNYVCADIHITESEKQERLNALDEVLDLLVHEYQPNIRELNAALQSNDKQATTRILDETIQAGEKIVVKLTMLYDKVALTAERISSETTTYFHAIIVFLFGMVTLLVILSVIVSAAMTRAIKVPVMQMENAMIEISKGNLHHPIRSDRRDELGLLANHIGDMVDNIAEINKVMLVMDNLDSLVTVIDLDYNLVYVNRSVADAFGLDLGNSKGKKCYKVIRNLDEPCSVCQLPKLLPHKDSFPTCAYEFVYDDALDKWIGGKASIIRWVDGSMVYVQSVKDETEKKNTQELLSEAVSAAETASRAKSAFLANMSHELRTPLNVIIGLTDLLRENEHLPEETRNDLCKISNGGHTLLSIVNDILDISKIESEKFSLTPVEYHTASLLNDTAIQISSRIGEKPVTFRLNIDAGLPSRLHGDDLRVKQILNNLLGNAIKYTQQGTIELGMHCLRACDDVWLEIVVADTGIGIREEDIPKLFNDFNQVDVQANRKIEGTGLGLAITKKLVESMEGEITVESEYGKGTVFRVRIRQGFVTDVPIGPVVAGNLRQFRYNENKHYFANTLVRVDLSDARVLIVDDLQANLDVAAGLLRKYHLQVDCVTSGQAAIERIQLGSPVYSAVFMDHMMPGMDGIEAADGIRKLGTDYAISIPMIALTANAVAGTAELFYEHGFQAFISKPIDIMQLDSVLMQWVNNKSNNQVLNEAWHDAQSGMDIPGVDAEKGLSICGGDGEIYRAVLHSYVLDTSAVLGKLHDVKAETLPAYRIAVHGIKGSSANIGAETVSQTAARLEEMARNGDLPGVWAINDAFLEETERLLASIKNCLAQQAGQTVKPRLSEPDRELLNRLRLCCGAFDYHGADQLLKELENADYDKDTELVTWLREKIDTFDFDEIAERLAEDNFTHDSNSLATSHTIY